MTETWKPTDFAAIDSANYFQLLKAVVDGRIFTEPDPDNPRCLVFGFTDAAGERSTLFSDEMLWLQRDGMVTFDDDFHALPTDAGKAYIENELARLEIMRAIDANRVYRIPGYGPNGWPLYTCDPAEGYKLDGSPFTLESLREDGYVTGHHNPYLTAEGLHRLQLLGLDQVQKAS